MLRQGRYASHRFQSTPPVKAATLDNVHVNPFFRISIHAAREGGDAVLSRLYGERGLFQSTPPVKAATQTTLSNGRRFSFQSTPPVKAATGTFLISPLDAVKISIHAAREGGDSAKSCRRGIRAISIHAAREGGDLFSIFAFTGSKISIHAAREGGDRRVCSCLCR